MRISRVVIRELKALADRNDSFLLDPGATPASSVCLRGLNGSGKTTYLDSIASIWGLFRRWSQKGAHIPPPEGDALRSADLVAIRLVEMPGPASELWLVYGKQTLWEAVPHRDGSVAGVLFTGDKGKPKNLLPRSDPLYRFWDERATKMEQRTMRNGVESLPNMVFIGAENRTIPPLHKKDDLFELAPEAAFRFLARYAPSERKGEHLENSMAALLAVDPERFAAIAEELHRVLPGLRLLNRADAKTRRPLVELKSGAEVTLEHLSAGERAALIALFTVARWMTPGGVVLIDEPELHQHVSLMRSNLAVLEHYVIKKMNGQLVVASHAPEVWDHFRATKRIIDLDLPSGGDAH